MRNSKYRVDYKLSNRHRVCARGNGAAYVLNGQYPNSSPSYKPVFHPRDSSQLGVLVYSVIMPNDIDARLLRNYINDYCSGHYSTTRAYFIRDLNKPKIDAIISQERKNPASMQAIADEDNAAALSKKDSEVDDILDKREPGYKQARFNFDYVGETVHDKH